MKQLRSVFLYALPVVLFLLQNGCSPEFAGATTETTNGVTGKLHNSDDTPAANIVVKLFPDDFDPLTDDESTPPVHDTTDENGTYRFKNILPGSYTVLALDNAAATGFYAGDIAVIEDSMTTISDGTLTGTGSVITDFSNSADLHSSGYVYLPGTDLYSRIEDAGIALLSNVPVGMFSRLILATGNDEKRNILSESITVRSDDTITIVNPQWKYHRDIILNTSPNGADISIDIYDFPVLIRLNENNFDFGQALSDGGDLVFTGAVNTPLAYEIEQWDADAQRAVIWVRIDTIYGSNSTQTITMYWGNYAATSSSNSTAVFDTATGYQGVWHLGDNSTDLATDATFNTCNGTAPEGMRPQLSEGIIGSCRTFDGDDDYITMPNTADGNLNFPEDGTYTVCAWVYLESSDNESHCIVAKGYEQYFLRSTYVENMTIVTEPLWEFVEFSENDKWQILTSSASDGEWVLLAGVCQGDRQFLYCNGEMVDSSLFKWPNDQVVRNTSNDLYIGRFAEEVTLPPMGPKVVGYNHFKGSIDEVRIISRSQSADWIRLCYMNQRPDDQLVQFK